MINFSLFQGNRIMYTQRSHKNSRMTEQNPYRAPQIKYNHTGRSWNSPGKERAWGRLLHVVLGKTPFLGDATTGLYLVEVLLSRIVMSQLGMEQILLVYSSGSPVHRPIVKPQHHVPKELKMR